MPPPSPSPFVAPAAWAMLALGLLLGAGGHALWVDRAAAQANVHAALATDVEDWALLARTQATQGRFAEALPACAKAMRLRPDDPTLMADCAEMMVNANGQKLEGEAAGLVAQALKIDPRNLKALVLAASAAAARGEHAAAVDLWSRALSAVPPEQPQLRPYLQGRLDDDRRKAGAPVVAAAPASAATPAPAAPRPAPAPAPNPVGGVAGTVALAPEVTGSVAPGDAVRITVAAAAQPDKPLYTLHKQVRDLPLALKVTPEQAPGLAGVQRVVVQAHVAHAGQARPQAGDWQGQTAPLAVGSTGFRLDVGDAVR